MYIGAVFVSSGRLPATITTLPNSPRARLNDSAAPVRIAGQRVGRVTRRKVVKAPAPSVARGLLLGRVHLQQHRLHAPDHERVRHEQQGQHDPRLLVDDAPAVPAEERPQHARRPVKRHQHQAGDDRRHGERQVDQGVDDPLAGESVADQDPGGRRARSRR